MDKLGIEQTIHDLAADLETGDYEHLERVSLIVATEAAIDKWLSGHLAYLLTKHVDLAHQCDLLSAEEIAARTGLPKARVEACLRTVNS